MPRRTKPAKTKVRANPSRTAPMREGGGVRALEKRLAESLARENAKDRALTEAREQQTATSEILRVISSSPTDVQPVFDAIVESSMRLCDGIFGTLFQFDGELIRQVAQHNYTAEALEEMRRV